MADVVIYTKPGCGFCYAALGLLVKKGVDFTEAPREESYGTVVVFRDLYGNLWDLVQHR